MKNKPLLQLVLFALCVAITPASAVQITFSDKTAFLAATAAADATGPLPNLGSVGTTPTTIGSITFHPLSGHGLWFGPDALPDWTPLLPGHDLAIDGTESMDVSFASAFSFGFDFAEPTAGDGITPYGFVDSTFTITLLSGAATVGSFTFNGANDIASFFGVSSDISFDGVRIRETVGGIEDEYFGHFYTGVQTAPVPDANSTAALLLVGLWSIAAIRQRYQMHAA